MEDNQMVEGRRRHRNSIISVFKKRF